MLFVCLCVGSHGQLGHGNLVSENEPQVVEALWGVTMKYVSAGGWHSASVGGENITFFAFQIKF